MALADMEGIQGVSMLDYHDAFAEFAHVTSIEKFSIGNQTEDPLVTIAIPTFRRPHLLIKALESAINQKFDRPVEILVIDNDPDQFNIKDSISSIIPLNFRHLVRYIVNTENIGMFGNWNRCIELARGKWVTILNDDDLLSSKYLQRMFRVLDKRPDIDGLVANKLFYAIETGRVIKEGSFLRSLIKYLAFRWRFSVGNITKVDLNKLYFGNELHNGLTFLFNKESVIKSGGYRSTEFPAADAFLYTRYCIDFSFYWLNEVLGYIGIGENESMNKSTMVAAMCQYTEYRRTLTSTHLPSAWMDLHPQMTANTALGYMNRFNVKFSRDEIELIEKSIGSAIPEGNYGVIRRFRFWNKGF